MNRKEFDEIVKDYRKCILNKDSLYIELFDSILNEIFKKQLESERPCQKCPNKEPLNQDSLIGFCCFFFDMVEEDFLMDFPNNVSVINSGHINIVWKDLIQTQKIINLTFSRKSRHSISFIITSDDFKISGYYKNSTDFLPHLKEILLDLLTF